MTQSPKATLGALLGELICALNVNGLAWSVFWEWQVWAEMPHIGLSLLTSYPYPHPSYRMGTVLAQLPRNTWDLCLMVV